MGGTTGLTDEDGAFLATSVSSSTGELNWTFRAGGGGGNGRSYVVINTDNDNGTYTGDAFPYPGATEPSEEDILITTKDPVVNAFEEGDSGFADRIDVDGVIKYFIDAFILV